MELLTSRDFQVGVVTGIGGVLAFYLILLMLGVVLRPWIMAKASGVDVGVMHLIGMHLRKTNPALVIGAHIMDQKRGAKHTLVDLEVAYIAFQNEARDAGELLRVADREKIKRSGAA